MGINYIYYCKDCGALISGEKNLENSPCPRCGKKALMFTGLPTDEYDSLSESEATRYERIWQQYSCSESKICQNCGMRISANSYICPFCKSRQAYGDEDWTKFSTENRKTREETEQNFSYENEKHETSSIKGIIKRFLSALDNKRVRFICGIIGLVLILFFIIGPIGNSSSSSYNSSSASNNKVYKQLGLSSEKAYSSVIEKLRKVDGFTSITNVKSVGIDDGLRAYWVELDGYYSDISGNVVKGDVFWLGFIPNTDILDSFYVNGRPVYENGKPICPMKKYTFVSSKELDNAFDIIKKAVKKVANYPSSVEINTNNVRYWKNEGVIGVIGSVYGKNTYNVNVETRYELEWNLLTDECNITVNGRQYSVTLTNKD